jgi:hypothetical protein
MLDFAQRGLILLAMKISSTNNFLQHSITNYSFILSFIKSNKKQVKLDIRHFQNIIITR